MLKSLQWRLVSIFILFAIVLIIVIGVVLNFRVQASYYESFKNGIENGFENWENAKWKGDISLATMEDVEEALKSGDARMYFYLISDYRSYTLLNSNASEIIDTSYDYSNTSKSAFLNQILTSKNVLSVLKGSKVGDSGNLIYADDSAFFDYACRVKLKDGDYIFYFRYDREEWRKTIDDLNKNIMSSLIAAIAASFIFGYVLSKTITVPVVNIMHKAKAIASGNFGQPLSVRSHDEIGELTNTFNYMARELKKTMVEISSEKSKVETILYNITDGVIGFDLEGRIIHINPAAKNMLEIDDVEGTFNDYSKKYDFGITLEDILYLGSTGSKEKMIRVGDKYINAYFALYSDREKNIEGVVVVLQDNTKQQKVENMRKEFIENVSHELKTPLTSIKSYAETLLDGAMEDKETTKRFLDVINSEADRMNRIVKDLLQLSSLDNINSNPNARMALKLTKISFVDLVKSCVDRMNMEARAKKQKLECYVIGDIPDIMADRDRMEQVVLNIISNAIKYTHENGEIIVYIGIIYNEIYMKVSDTGIGIPEEDLSRVFERFYRVDKARSRQMGGTGLGLAIAKEIVEVHGGSISIKSEYGKGTEVTIKLPIVTEN